MIKIAMSIISLLKIVIQLYTIIHQTNVLIEQSHFLYAIQKVVILYTYCYTVMQQQVERIEYCLHQSITKNILNCNLGINLNFAEA